MRLRAPTVVAADAHLLVVEVERDEVAGLDVDAVALGAGRVVEVFVEERVGAGAEERRKGEREFLIVNGELIIVNESPHW